MTLPPRRFVLRADISFEGVSLFDARMQLAEYFQELADTGEPPPDWFEGTLDLAEDASADATASPGTASGTDGTSSSAG